MESANHSQNQENNKPIATLAVFDSRAHFSFVFKKTEKLSAAVYVVTNFIKDNEPIKWSLREKSIELIEVANMLRFALPSERRNLLTDHQSLTSEILALFAVAFQSGLVSEMNHSILKRELENLMNALSENEKKQDGTSLHPEFFETKSAPEIPKTQNAVLYESPKSIEPLTTPVKIKKDISERKTVSESLIDGVKKENQSDDIKDKRRAAIFNLLRKKEGLGIKDFATAIRGVSEKTIQRELLSLVAEGALRKEGDRRWSRYFLGISK